MYNGSEQLTVTSNNTNLRQSILDAITSTLPQDLLLPASHSQPSPQPRVSSDQTLEQDAKARLGGWKDGTEQRAATAAGFTDPGIYRQNQSKIAAAATAAVAAKKADEQALLEENRRKGFHCLSPWDGSSAELIAQVKAQLRDPDSFEAIETKIAPRDENGMHAVAMTYRARNGFGGMNVETAMGTIVNETCATKFIVSK